MRSSALFAVELLGLREREVSSSRLASVRMLEPTARDLDGDLEPRPKGKVVVLPSSVACYNTGDGTVCCWKNVYLYIVQNPAFEELRAVVTTWEAMFASDIGLSWTISNISTVARL
jgi:hypothetical protein